jgi:predicted MPP superfamily phosphohydrolase
MRFARQWMRAARAGAGVERLLPRALSAKRPELTRHVLRIDALPGQLDGLRLLHVTDLHVRDGSGPSAWLPEIASTLSYDLTLYTGDFIDGDDDIKPLATLLSAMPAQAPSYAVLGNHDYWSAGREPRPNDMARLGSALSEVGVTVLRNAAALACGGRIYVAGVDDPVTGLDDAGAAMAAVPPNAACILLAHSPDVLQRLAGHKPTLVLAGHTHGGQVRLPVPGPVFNVTSLPRRLAMGYHVHEGTPLFVSRGVGYSGLDIRFRCPPQIALLELRVP